MRLPAYPRYMDSGVEWLGEVPEHWTVHPLKRAIAKIESGTSVNASDYPATPGSYGVLKTSCVYTGQFDWKENKTVDNEDLHRVSCPLKIDTLVVSRMNTPDLVGATGLVTEAPNGIFLPDRLWQIYLERRQSPSFIFYFTKSSEYREQVKIACSGTSSSMQNLGQDDFRSLLFVEPPTSEQTQIARFLDHETARIDALIEEQQRLIELLKEKRQAVISHAVTKGLDPTVPMKDSGVEWLGEVPAHWEVVRLKNISRIVDCKNRTPEYVDDGEYLVVRTSNIKKQQLSLDNALYTDRDNFEIWTERGIPPPGSIFFTREAPSGEVCIVPADTALCMGQRMMNIIPIDSGLTPFIFDFLTSDCLTKYIESEASGSTVVHLRVEQVYNIPLVIPPKIERDEIDKLVGELKAQYEVLIAQSEASVVLLYERRSALISAAVTGKIDVRRWQPPASATSPELAQEAV